MREKKFLKNRKIFSLSGTLLEAKESFDKKRTMENLINVIFELTIYLLPFNSFKNFVVSGFPLLAIKPTGPKRLEVVIRTKILQNLISLAEKDRDVMLMLIIYNWSVSWKLIAEEYFSRKL